MDPYSFQYCQKIVVLSTDETHVLLARRQGEKDHNDTYTFVGGKMEVTDKSIVAGLKREKDEELGEGFKIEILPTHSYNILFTKHDGKQMIVPHYLAYHYSGDVMLSDEYSDWQWVDLDKLDDFGPKIANIAQVTRDVQKFALLVEKQDFVLI